jgi:hypothetical protein
MYQNEITTRTPAISCHSMNSSRMLSGCRYGTEAKTPARDGAVSPCAQTWQTRSSRSSMRFQLGTSRGCSRQLPVRTLESMMILNRLPRFQRHLACSITLHAPQLHEHSRRVKEDQVTRHRLNGAPSWALLGALLRMPARLQWVHRHFPRT